MKKRNPTKYELAKQDRLRRVKNRSNKREILLASVASLIGTMAIVVIGNKLTEKSSGLPQNNHPPSKFTKPTDYEPEDWELSATETKKQAFLDTCLIFYNLLLKNNTFTESLTKMQGGNSPQFNDGKMTYRNLNEHINGEHLWLKIWCSIGGRLNTQELEATGGCNEIDKDVQVGSLVITRDEIENYIHSKSHTRAHLEV
tara:strand:+ start:782 stop:1381 length:600 start_codon:yes stop_codon:yes gene_type:complete